jgi:hypothetical protein
MLWQPSPLLMHSRYIMYHSSPNVSMHKSTVKIFASSFIFANATLEASFIALNMVAWASNLMA